MKLIKPTVEIIKQEEYDLNHIFKFIELAGRTCYKSEDKITEDSAKEFVDRMIKSGHGAMLEHGTVYLKITYKDIDFAILYMFYERNKYSVLNHSEDNKIYYITTNYRVLVENNHLNDLKYLCEPTLFHKRRTTVKFICDRGVSHEFVRHRVFSFAQESTRYCNYSKDKFGNELTFILPNWVNENYKSIENSELTDLTFRMFLEKAEETYFLLLKLGWTPQQARNVLPNSLKTELVMTGFNDDWRNFFKLRCAPNAHPQAKELADMLKDKFNK